SQPALPSFILRSSRAISLSCQQTWWLAILSSSIPFVKTTAAVLRSQHRHGVSPWFRLLRRWVTIPYLEQGRASDQEETMKRVQRGYWLVLLLVLAAAVAWAGEKGPELKEGVLYGVVMDADSQKPIAGATVAAFDK